MKRILLLFLILPFLAVSQIHKGEISPFIPITIPVKSQMPFMSSAIGIGLKGGYKPWNQLPFLFELKASINSYSNRTLSQTFLFGDGSSTQTNVTYSSGFNQTSLGLKIQIGSDLRLISGFVTPQIGTLRMRSKIVVADPMDEDGCAPLDRKTTHKYRGFFVGAEAGIDLDFALIWKSVPEGKNKFTFSVMHLYGLGLFNYVNVKYMKDHEHHLMEEGEVMAVTDEGRTDITASFINVSTQNIHQHKIAELYNTGLRMWQFSLGMTFRF
jgi:hypothetical protein